MQRAKKDMHSLKKAISRNVAKKKELEEQLEKQQETMRPAEQRMVQLLAEVDTQSRRARHAHGAAKQLQSKLAKAEQQMAMVEIQKLELEQAQVVQEGMMRERELALQKVELQVQLRDRALGLLCRGAKVRGLDINALLSALAVGPMEPVLKPHIKEENNKTVNYTEEGDDEHDHHGDFKNLAASLKRSSRLDDLMGDEDETPRGHSARSDESKDGEEGKESEREHKPRRAAGGGGGGGGGGGNRSWAKAADESDAEEPEDYDDNYGLDEDDYEPVGEGY